MSSSRDFLGPYQLLRQIRAGQTCSVWEARASHRNERVALKVLLDRHRNNKAEYEHLKHEALVGKQLEHPYVIQIYDYSDEYGLPFIVMQLFNARNLKQELRERKRQVLSNITPIISRSGQALEYLHSQNWIHCDIKPDNFLVDGKANVKLIDFSIAVEAKKKSRLSGWFKRPKTIQGTRSYMSPEQIRRQPLDVRTDIYSFGCVCFELLAGKPPYSGVNPDELLNKHLRSQIPSLPAFNPAVTSDFAVLVSRMLAKNADDRPQTMEDVNKLLKKTPIFRPGMRPDQADDDDS